MMKINKLLLVALLVVLSTCYTEQDHVLVLGDDDFPKITEEFKLILIEFYAPWCGHCKKLQPVYKQVAAALKEQNSQLRVAKLDATVHKEAASQYSVRGYPTLFFFYNGEKMDYNGPRTKDGMLGWLLKRTRDPVSQIDAEKYEQLKSEPTVSIVYHGDFSKAENAQLLKKHAISDDYNNYYFGHNLGKQAGTIQLIRNFADHLTYNSIDQGIKKWISKNERAPVVDFDQRAIGQIFSNGKKGVVFFNGQSNEQLLTTLNEVAQQWDGQQLVFTEVSAKNEHIDNFAKYIKLDRKAYPIVIVEAKAQTKYVLKQQPTKQNIVNFLSNYKDFKYGMTDEVKPEEKEETKTNAGEAEAQEEQL